MATNDTVIFAQEAFGHLRFGVTDYILFGMLLLVSLAIGIYFGFFSKQDNTTEYLLGGKRMGFFPVAMSIIASHISGITLLGVPSEVYRHGSQYTACIVTSIVTCLVTAYISVPVFYKLQLASTFEYLEVRFSRSVRTLCSILFAISLFIYIPIVVYVPALAFAQVSGFSLHVVTPVLCTVCIIYTSIGGLKAVVWTDTVQFTVTAGGLFAVLALGINSVGGVAEIWKRSEEGGRLIFFDMDPSPFARNSFWGMALGMTVTWIGHIGVHQGSVQRFLAVPRQKDARRAIGIFGVGIIIVKLVSVFTGLIMFAKYHDCDPLLTKAVSRLDQTLPYYVMDVSGDIPGLPGLFLAGLVSAALATMSASLNTVSGTIYEDFIDPWIPESPRKEALGATIMKVIVIIVGAITVGSVFFIEKLGSVFQMAISMRSVTDGPSLGIFFLGMLVPWANAKGAIFGGSVGLLVMFIIAGGAHWHVAHGRIRHVALPTSVDGCPYPLNETVQSTSTIDASFDMDAQPIALFRISFMYYSLIGASIVVVVGVISSYALDRVNLEEINPDHIAPIMRRFLPPRKYSEVPLKPFEMKDVPEEKRNKADVVEIIERENEDKNDVNDKYPVTTYKSENHSSHRK